MSPTTLKRYQDLLNIGIAGKDRQVRPVDKRIRYITPDHVAMVDIPHEGEPEILYLDGKDVSAWERKTPEEASKITYDSVAHFPIDHLRKILDCCAPKSEITLSYSTDYPIRIDAKLDEETPFTAWVAPRIEPER